MKQLKRATTALLAAAMLLAMSLPAFAADGDTGFTDVPADAWYAEAVTYVRDNDLMGGTGGGAFSPETDTSRGQIATILHRAAGSPAVTGTTQFPDVDAAAYYGEAVRWASAQGVVSGYSNGNFGPNDPITREQLAAILWRYAGSPAADAGEDFADEAAISSYAAAAVDWARTNGIVGGIPQGTLSSANGGIHLEEGNRFDPNGSATRAQVAVILRNYMELEADQPDQPAGSRVLVVYYSATGSTEAVAQTIADTLDGDLFELIPTDPYTSADLNWTADGSRVNREHDNEALHDIALTSATVENWADYDTVFIGYPIWWGIAAWPVNAFIQANDFNGKTVIPFATSSSSGLGQSGALLEEMAGTGNWLDGQRFSSGVSSSTVEAWVNGLDLPAAPDAPSDEVNHSTLVVYFSMPETTKAGNMTTEEDNSVVVIDGQVLGNTQYMAQVIAEETGGDMFRIEPVTPYPTDHRTLVDLASQEQDDDARPAIRGSVELDGYDTVFIGYPIWWSDMPQILYTFFDSYDLSLKTVIPFSTHGGSGFAGTPGTIRELEPDATILDGLTISRDSIQEAREQISDWVNGLDIA